MFLQDVGDRETPQPSFSVLYVDLNDFLGKEDECFPVAFSTILNSEKPSMLCFFRPLVIVDLHSLLFQYYMWFYMTFWERKMSVSSLPSLTFSIQNSPQCHVTSKHRRSQLFTDVFLWITMAYRKDYVSAAFFNGFEFEAILQE